MEMLEMELIKKLQNTQAIQKQAYTELEEAINTRPAMMNPGGSLTMQMNDMQLNQPGSGENGSNM